MLSLILQQVLAWNPSTSDLSGTDSSSSEYSDNSAENRFDIPGRSGTNGLQVGEDVGDTSSIAFLIKLDLGNALPHRFTVSKMLAGDQYEVYFTIGEVSFCILFHASGGSAGTCTLYNLTGSSWTSCTSLSVSNIVSGTLYSSTNYEIGFILTDATDSVFGYVKFVISKQFLYNCGARSNVVTGIYATALLSGSGTPGSGTSKDRCPGSGSVSWTLQGDIPDLPMGVLLLVLPLIAIYAYLRRSRREWSYGFKSINW
jgi:hypothetical protein